MSILMLVRHIEKECGVTIPPEGLTPANLATIDTIAALVESLQR